MLFKDIETLSIVDVTDKDIIKIYEKSERFEQAEKVEKPKRKKKSE